MTIDEAITRISAWASATSVVVAPLAGGITNTNYRVDVDGEAFVVRIWASQAALLGIDRRREHRCAVAASQSGVTPEIVHFLPDVGVTVTRFVEGRSLSPAADLSPETLGRVVRSIHRCHGGAAFDASFSVFRTIDRYLGVARRTGARLPQDIETLHQRVRAIESTIERSRTTVRPCHNDLWGPNLIDDGRDVHIVDWEYAGMGDPCFDLANFAIYHCPSDREDEALLQAYAGQVPQAMWARVKLLRAVAETREALWYLAALTVAPDPAGFTGSAATHFDRCRRALADPRMPAWLDHAGRID